MTTWNLSIIKCRDGFYELRLDIPGAPGGGYLSTRALPPDFSDFLSSQACDKPNRKWRRAPASVGKEDDLLFCAGNLDTLKEIGSRLYDSVSRFGPEGEDEDLTATFLALRAKADKALGLGLRINLTRAPELSRIPWEALYIAKKGLLLGIDTRTNIVRHLESDSDGGLPPAVKPPVRMLVAVANLDSGLEVGAEVADIALRLGSLPRDNDRYHIDMLEQATRVQLHSRIVEWKPHIIHFIGHGGFDDEQGLIYLHSGKDPAKRDAIDSDTLSDLVRNDPPWLVVLNSCQSGTAARADPFAGAAQNLIRANVPFVVAMQAPISDDAAVQFSQEFYTALATDETVATAVTRGRAGIRGLEDGGLQAELITPVLYSNGKAERIEMVERKRKEWKAERILAILAGIAAIIGVPIGIMQIYGSRSVEAPGPSSISVREMSPGRPAEPLQGDELAPPPEPSAFDAADGDYPKAAEDARMAAPEWRRAEPAEPAAQRRSVATQRPRSSVSARPARAPVLRRYAWRIAPAGPRAAWRMRGPPERGAVRRRYREGARPTDNLSAGSVLGVLSGRFHFRRYARPRAVPPATAQVPPTRDRQLFGWSATSEASRYGDILGPPDGSFAEPNRSPTGQLLVAAFAPGSSAPSLIEIERYAAALSSPAGARMSLELVGGVDPFELAAADPSAAAADALGVARAENVAASLRARGVSEERIVTVSAGAARTGTLERLSFSGRGVEARLTLRGADRVGFAAGSVEPEADSAATLDRAASFARANSAFLLLLEGRADWSEPNAMALELQRAERVAAEFRGRGVDPARLLTRGYPGVHLDAPDAAAAAANRRVQIVLIPPEPEPTAPSAPPPDLPRQP